MYEIARHDAVEHSTDLQKQFLLASRNGKVHYEQPENLKESDVNPTSPPTDSNNDGEQLLFSCIYFIIRFLMILKILFVIVGNFRNHSVTHSPARTNQVTFVLLAVEA